MESISFSRCFADGLEAFKKYIGIVIGVTVVYMVINSIASSIPAIGPAWGLTGAFALAGGFIVFLLNVIKSTNPNFNDLFGQFNDFVRWMVVGLLLLLYTLIALVISAVPTGLFALIGLIGGSKSFFFYFMLGLGGLISVILFVAIVIRWSFVYYVAADEKLTAKAAIERSEELTAGIRPQVFAVNFLAGLIGVAGVLALGVGVIFTLPLSYCITTALYVNTKALRSPQQELTISPELQ